MIAGDEEPADLLDIVVNPKISSIMKDELVELYEESYFKYPEYSCIGYHNITDYFDWLKERRNSSFWLATCREKPVGFAAATPNKEMEGDEKTGEVLEIVVSPRFKGNGLGRRLLGLLESFLEQKGNSRIGLEVGSGNVEAINLYNKQGFRVFENDGTWIRMFKDKYSNLSLSKLFKKKSTFVPTNLVENIF